MESHKVVEGKTWSNLQAYGLAVICLLLGLPAGYLAQKSSQPAIRQPIAQNAATAAAAPVVQPSPEQMKHMADKQAEPLLAQLQKHPNDIALLTELSKTYYYAHQLPASAEYLERASKIKRDPELLAKLGAIYHLAGDDGKATQSLNRALMLDPNSASALYNLGMLKWQAQGDPKGAINAWEKLLKSNPDFPKRAEVEAMIAQAREHISIGAAGKAEAPK